jgi:hypothetical protein
MLLQDRIIVKRKIVEIDNVLMKYQLNPVEKDLN